ncbi:MAG: nucleotide pyrophosphohydrolase [Saprospiraceae bacterium]
MTMNEAQHQVDNWIKQYGGGYYSELTNLGILAEEVGEMAHWIVRKYGDQSLKSNEKEVNIEEAIIDEMADVFWVLICLANQMNIDLAQGFLKNLEKKTNRDSDRHIKKRI